MNCRPERSRAIDHGCALWLAALCSLWAARASAHGEMARVTGVATLDEAGREPTVLRLTEGLAQRDAAGSWRFVCPALWEQDVVTPSAGLPGGPTLVGGSSGLYVLTQQGAVEPHPLQEARRGRTVSLRAGAERLWQLRDSGDSGEIVAVSLDEVEVVESAAIGWDSLAATAGLVQVVRRSAGRIEQRLLSPSGELTDEHSAAEPQNTVAVFARTAGDTPYLTVWVDGGLRVQLARIEQGELESIAQASEIAGPVTLPSGTTFVALDGQLATLDPESAEIELLDQRGSVTCLAEHSGLAYACVDSELRELDDDGLGRTLFALAQLTSPAAAPEDPELAARCELQWQRFVIDLMLVGVDIDEGGEPGNPDASAGGEPDERDASADPSDPRDAAVADGPTATDDGGCGCSAIGAHTSADSGWGAALVTALLLGGRFFRIGDIFL